MHIREIAMRINQHIQILRDRAFDICFAEEAKQEAVGGFFSVGSKTVPSLQVTFEFTEAKSAPLVINKLAIGNSKWESESKEQAFLVDQLAKSQELQQREGLVSSQIQSVLYVDKFGRKLTPFAELLSLSFYVETLRKQGKSFTFDQFQNLVGQMLKGLKDLHKKQIVHRDLKLANILVFLTPKDELLIKFIDLDSLDIVNAETGYGNAETTCDPFWSAPEVLLAVWAQEGSLSTVNYFTADSYSLGCMIQNLIACTAMTSEQEVQALDLVHKLKCCKHEDLSRESLVKIFPKGEARKDVRNSAVQKRQISGLLKQKEHLPTNRLSIEKACGHQLFGATADDQKSFFDGLKRFDHVVEINGVPVKPHPAINDETNLMPPEIKAILAKIEALDGKAQVAELIKIKKMVENVLKDKNFIEYHAVLRKLTVDLKADLREALSDAVRRTAIEACLGKPTQDAWVDASGGFFNVKYKSISGLQVAFKFNESKEVVIIDKFAVGTLNVAKMQHDAEDTEENSQGQEQEQNYGHKHAKQHKKSQRRVNYINKSQEIQREEKLASAHLLDTVYIDSAGRKVTPYAKFLSLYDFICGRGKFLDKKQLQNIMGQIFRGLRVLHENNCAHRDLNIKNILVFPGPHGELLIKICDFDSLIKVGPDGCAGSETTKHMGPPEYAAPEVQLRFLGLWDEDKPINFLKADMYSCGSILRKLIEHTEMTAKEEKLAGHFVRQLTKCDTKPGYLVNCFRDLEGGGLTDEEKTRLQSNLKQTVKATLVEDNLPAKRFSIDQACVHSFFTVPGKSAQQFFVELAARFDHKVEINGVTVDPHPKMDDFCNLMPVLPAEIIAITKEFNELDESKANFVDQVIKLNKQVLACLNNKKHKALYNDLKAIQNDLREDLDKQFNLGLRAVGKTLASAITMKPEGNLVAHVSSCLQIAEQINATQRLPFYTALFKKCPSDISAMNTEARKTLMQSLQKISDSMKKTVSELPAPGYWDYSSIYKQREKEFAALQEKVGTAILQLMRPEDLVEAAGQALIRFIKMNKLSAKNSNGLAKKFIDANLDAKLTETNYESYQLGFFSVAKHGQVGLERNAKFYDDLRISLPAADQINNPTARQNALGNMLRKLQEHLYDDNSCWDLFSQKGGWQEGRSFKPLLLEELQKITDLNFNKWQDKLHSQAQPGATVTAAQNSNLESPGPNHMLRYVVTA